MNLFWQDFVFSCFVAKKIVLEWTHPLEVKAGKTGTLKSLQMYLYEKKLNQGIRFNMDIPNKGMFASKINAPGKNAELSWKLMSLPLYMVSELKRLIDME